MFKENFKRFGLLAVPSLITGLVGKIWDERAASYFCYSIPIIYAIVRIRETNEELKNIKKLKKKKS